MTDLKGHFTKRSASKDRPHNGDEIPGYESTNLDYQIMSDVREKKEKEIGYQIVNFLNGGRGSHREINPDDWYYDENNDIQYRGKP